MASLTLTGGENEMTWQITGLSSAFNKSNYKGAAIASSYQGDGIDSLSYFAYSTAPASRTAKYTPEYSRWMSAGTYTFYGYACAANGKYYYAGADSCVVTKPEPEPTIPYYTVDTITQNSFDINWFQTVDYPYLRLYVRTQDNTTVLDQWISTGGYSSYRTVSGLSAGTTYVVNVAYNTSASASGSTWLGATTVTTSQPTTYTLTVYHYYNGSVQSTEYKTITAGNTVYPYVYADEPSGYEYDHAESPWGTTVSSITMNGNKSVFLIYTAIQPTTPTATVTVTNRTSSSLTVSASLTTTLTRSDAWYICISTSSSFATYTSYQGSGTSVSHQFTGLSAHTTYYFKVLNVYNGIYAWQSSYTKGTTRYANFAWDNGDNINNRQPTANEWNRLVTFVENTCGVTVPTSIKNTIYVGGTLSSGLFNELASDVGYAQAVSKGSRIYKTVLNALKDQANTHT